MPRTAHEGVRDPGELTGRVFGDLVQIVHGIGRAGAQELRSHGLTPAQYQVLVLVLRRPGLVQRELTDLLGVTKGNVSQLLTRMQDAGLLERAPDGAANQVSLTPDGAALARRLMPEHQAFLARCFAALSPAELAVLAGFTARLRAIL